MMQISIALTNAIAWVTLTGKMWNPKDLSSLEQKIHVLAEESGKGAVIDLTGISFISSSGLGYLVRLYDIFHQKGKRMVIFNPQDDIKEIIELSAVNSIVPVTDKQEKIAEIFA
jgi:anti-anti-sigma factor